MRCIFSILLVVLFVKQSNSQSEKFFNKKSEIHMFYSFGIPIQNFRKPSLQIADRLDHQYANCILDQQMMLTYQKSIKSNKSNSLFIGAGLGYSQTNYVQKFADYKYNYLLDYILFNSNSLCIPLKIGVEHSLIKDLLFFEFSYNLNYNLNNTQKTYAGFKSNIFDFIDHEYTLSSNSKSSFNHIVSVASKLKIFNQFYLFSSLSYLTNKQIDYNYKNSMKYYMKDQNGNIQIQGYSFESLDKINLKNSFLYLSIGITNRF